MKKTINRVHVEGYLYDFRLEKKMTSMAAKNPNSPYLFGDLDIATNEDCTNIVTVHYGFVNEGNAKYNFLKSVLEGFQPTVLKNGKDSAVRLRIDSDISANEFYSNSTGSLELVSIPRIDNGFSGFLHETNRLNSNESERATFEEDMLITNVRVVEGDPDTGTSTRAMVKGFVFNYKGKLIPVEFSAFSDGAIGYFDGLGVNSKNPVFTKIRGRLVSQTVVRKIEEESAFGPTMVREVPTTKRAMEITWAASETYEFDSEGTLLASELKEKLAERSVELAELKNRAETRNATPTPVPNLATAVSDGGFDF